MENTQMTLKEVMQKNVFALLGDTLNEEKYAYKIKQGLLQKGYSVFCVGKELSSLNEIDAKIEVVDLCIHPAKAILLLKECEWEIPFVVIQPGAESEEIFEYLNKKSIPYIQSCLLLGLKMYK